MKALAVDVGVSKSCDALQFSRSTFYRLKNADKQLPPSPRKPHPRALTSGERAEVLDQLHSERFMDKAPAEVYATLLDEEKYLCSTRTMYRILDAENEVKERRNQRRHPTYDARVKTTFLI